MRVGSHPLRLRGAVPALGLLLAMFVCAPVPSSHADEASAPRGALTPRATQPPLSLPMIPPGTCGNCHGDYDFRPAPIEPYVSWSGSMMANAGRDPIFWAAVDVANNDIPGVGSFCLRCHSPRGWLEGRVEGVGGSPDGCSLVGKIDQPDNDFSGVDCHLCHRMMENPSPPVGEQSLYLDNGQYWIDDEACDENTNEPCRRGPYAYPAPRSPPPHPWAESPLHRSSDICGTCHNVTSPAKTLLIDGVDTAIPYPIERTHREWEQSDFSKPGPGFASCQDCHMPQPDPTIEGQWACANHYFEPNDDRTGDFAVHEFAGGNYWVPEVLRGEYPNLLRGDEFLQTRDWAIAMLTEKSATIAVDAPEDFTAGEKVRVDVRVTNLTGHKLPTGYVEGRRMWLSVRATDGEGVEIFTSGAYDVATGVLTQDPQLKLYHSLRGVWNWNGTNECDHVDDGSGKEFFHFVLNDCIIEDNRIPPAGFTGGDDPETKPYSYNYPETSEGSGVLVNFDDTSYEIPVPLDATGPIDVEVKLLFQVISKEYVEFLRDESIDQGFADDCIERTSGVPTQTRGEILYEMWENYDRSAPIAMTEATVAIGRGIFEDDFETGDSSRWSSHIP